MMQFHTQYPVSESIRQLAEKSAAKLFDRKDLGYLQLPEREEIWSRANDWAQKLRKKTDQLVVIGLGGSALGGKALVRILGNDNVIFLHNTDPHTVARVLTNKTYIEKAQFLVVSKSGNTLEIAVLLSLLTEKLGAAGRSVADAVSVITEKKDSALHQWAMKEGLPVCPHPMDVGGRFSVLSEVGLIPAAFSGVNLSDVRRGAQGVPQMQKLLAEFCAYYLQTFKDRKSISVFWSYSDRLETFLPWLVQLWAESLGKKLNRQGGAAPEVSTPMAAMGASDQHSVLQQFMEGAKDKSILFIDESDFRQDFTIQQSSLAGFEYIRNKTLSEVYRVQSRSTQEALKQAEVPVARLTVDPMNAEVLGGLFMLFELTIGVLGEALDINAFDQPGVELGKKIAQKELSKT